MCVLSITFMSAIFSFVEKLFQSKSLFFPDTPVKNWNLTVYKLFTVSTLVAINAQLLTLEKNLNCPSPPY